MRSAVYAVLIAVLAGLVSLVSSSSASVAQEENGRPNLRNLIERFDTDGDGRLSAEERAKARELFQRFRGNDADATPGETPDAIPEKLPADAALYKPQPGKHKVAVKETLELKDEKRDKTLSLRISYPEESGSYPLIVFSHGAFGSKDGYQPLITYWVSHGYVVIQPTHEDSLALRSPEELANFKNPLEELKVVGKYWRTRPEDVTFILDSLDTIEKQVDGLAGKIDRKKIGMSGHSYGAHTTQLVASTKLVAFRREVKVDDERPIAFIALSPQGEGQGLQEASWDEVTRPILYVTGDKDAQPGTDKAGEWRKGAFDHTPDGKKYLLWVKDATHGFGGITGPVRFAGSGPDANDHVRIVQTTTTAFWDAKLKDDTAAKEYLESDKLNDVTKGMGKVTQK